MKIEVLLFDLGKVLINFDFQLGVSALHACCPLSRDEFERVLWDKVWVRRYERGEISTRDFHRYLCETAKLNLEVDEFCRIWSSVFLPELLISEELLAALRERYRLILVSNTNEAHVDFIRSNYRVFDYFDHRVLSFEVGSLKPDSKIFEHAIAAAARPPEALFFTDDREENVTAARRLGIHAHQFLSESRLVEALQGAGVDVEGIRGRRPNSCR